MKLSSSNGAIRPPVGRILQLKPWYGLANRLRAIASGFALANETRRRLVIYWFETDDCRAKWNDLFERSEAFDVIDISPGDSAGVEAIFSSRNGAYFPSAKVEEFVEMCKDESIAAVAHESFRHFHSRPTYEWLVPIAQIGREVDRVMHGGGLIGIHIRRADNREAAFVSPTELFCRKIRMISAERPSARFFLATDDPKEKQRLTDEFGGRVVTRDNLLERCSVEGMREALTDLLLLSRCESVYGTAWSSFSREAARIGKVCFTVLEDSTKIALTIILKVAAPDAHVRWCLESLMKQWLWRIEVLCIFDEKAGPLRACVDECARKDVRKRIRVADPAVRLLSQVRGKYVYFMESSSFATVDMSKQVFEIAEARAADLILFRADSFAGRRENDWTLARRMNAHIRRGTIAAWMHQKSMPWTCARRMFRSAGNRLLRPYEVAFGLRWLEVFCPDATWAPDLGSASARVCFLFKVLVQRRVHAGNVRDLEAALAVRDPLASLVRLAMRAVRLGCRISCKCRGKGR